MNMKIISSLYTNGDDFETSEIDQNLMNSGNNQEGIGIYFATDINPLRFLAI